MSQTVEAIKSTTFFGRKFSKKQLMGIKETVDTLPGLSVRELGHTICEHLHWVTPKGKHRIQSCLRVLEELEKHGIIKLKTKRKKKKTAPKEIPKTSLTDEQPTICCSLNTLMPIRIHKVTEDKDIKLWNEFVDRYHYLGYKRLIGTHMRYFITSDKKKGMLLGCMAFSFPTRSLRCRDQWIGWDHKDRMANLSLIINNNRFLIFPWVQVKLLASKALSITIRQISSDWEKSHGYKPVLVETFVDPTRFKGTCYKAANWQLVGRSAGRKVSKNGKGGISQKDYYVYPLTSGFKSILKNRKKVSPSHSKTQIRTIPLTSMVKNARNQHQDGGKP